MATGHDGVAANLRYLAGFGAAPQHYTTGTARKPHSGRSGMGAGICSLHWLCARAVDGRAVNIPYDGGDCKGDVQAGFLRGTKDNALYVKIVRGSKTLRLYKVQTGY